MGNNNSHAISINLDQTDSFYFGGDTVSGTTALNVSEGKVKANEVYIQLTGEIGYTTTRTVTDSNGNSSTQTDYHHIPFFYSKSAFVQPQLGEKEIVFGEGQYSWPFQLSLTERLPPTMNQPQSYPHVRYYLQVVIDKKWYKQNERQTKYITVFPRVNLLQNPQCLSSFIFGNHNRKEITLKGTLNKSGFVSGELVHMMLEIENPRRILIKHIELSLIQSYQIGGTALAFHILKTTLPKIINLKDEHINETHSIQIPSMMLPPSYEFQGGIRIAAVVTIHYMLRFAVKVKGMFTNFDIDIPIILGTSPDPTLNHQQTFYPTNISYSSDQDLPPSYDSVMQKT
jgi:hypothetical protein